MNYALIREMDISNGKGFGVSLFVSGCHFHCEGCFNKETWDFDYGEPWNKKSKEYFQKLLSKDYITRVSILGGEPLADENVYDVRGLIRDIKQNFPNKKIWLFTGYTIEEVIDSKNMYDMFRSECILNADYVIDGRFEIKKRDLTLDFRGSSNQRILTHEDIVRKLNDKD